MNDLNRSEQRSQVLHQQRQLQQLILFTLLAYLVFWGLGLLSHWLGWYNGPIEGLWFGLIASTLIQATFWWFVRSGRNQTFIDPRMITANLVCAATWVTYWMSLVQEERGVVMSLYFAIALFGVFRLDQKALPWLTSAAAVQYALLILLEYIIQPIGFDLGQNAFQWLLLSALLATIWLLSNHMLTIRDRVKRQVAELHHSQHQMQQQKRELMEAQRQLQASLKRLNELATRDELTGLANRRQALDTLNQQVRQEGALSVCILDIDFFKKVNDRFGHQAGDEVLRRFAHIAANRLREGDLLARFGGEEFVMMLPNTHEEEAKACCERVRERIEQEDFGNIASELTVTVSIGATQYQNGERLEAALDRADQALYQAKQKGRNQVIWRSPASRATDPAEATSD